MHRNPKKITVRKVDNDWWVQPPDKCVMTARSFHSVKAGWFYAGVIEEWIRLRLMDGALDDLLDQEGA